MNAIAKFMQQIADYETRKVSALAAGKPALDRLFLIAQKDTGQALTIRRVLLGLYNGHRFPFDLTTLRGLDTDLFDDCMAVITMDAQATIKEIHEYIDPTGRLFESWAKPVVNVNRIRSRS